MNKEYITLLNQAQDEIIINKSRFIGHASPVTSESEALDFLQNIRQKHKDATHNCYAYVIGTNAGIMRYSDDGQPGGTAGLPIMDVLKSQHLVNCAVVVTRYFGGVLLGTGGLVRAYTQGTKIAIDASGIVTMVPSCVDLCQVPYSYWDRVQYHSKSLPIRIIDISFTTSVSFSLCVREIDHDSVLEVLTKVTDGQFFSIPDRIEFLPW